MSSHEADDRHAADDHSQDPPSSTLWYCVQSKPGEEDIAWINLERQGFTVFLPLARVKKYRDGRRQWVTTKLFPRYLFVAILDDEPHTTIRSTLGVSTIISFGDKPARVPGAVINEIKAHCRDGVITLEEPEMEAGDEMEIIDGPYSGMKAIFDRSTNNEERVLVLLNIMESEAKVEIDRGQVKKVDP